MRTPEDWKGEIGKRDVFSIDVLGLSLQTENKKGFFVENQFLKNLKKITHKK